MNISVYYFKRLNKGQFTSIFESVAKCGKCMMTNLKYNIMQTVNAYHFYFIMLIWLKHIKTCLSKISIAEGRLFGQSNPSQFF